jgi:outer membrane protein TolC
VPFDKSDTDSPAYQAGLDFSISQPLLRDAGFQTNVHFIRLAQYQRKIVDAQTKLQAIRVLANADRAYWSLYSARNALEINRHQYGLAIQQLDETRKRVAAGASARIEITRSESGAASRLTSIIVSETNVRQRERDLKRIMHRPDMPVDSDTAIITTTKPNPVDLVLSAKDLANHAIQNRMEMLQLELQLAQDASSIDFARNQTLPLFVLDFDYSLLHSGHRSFEAIELTRPDNSSNWAVNLRADIPLGNQAAKSQLQRAILERVQRLSTREQQQELIVQEVYGAVDLVDETWQRILAAKDESILAARTYEVEKRQNAEGNRTSTDVLDAAGRWADAQLREIDSLADYEVARVGIAFATGTLLGHGRIILPQTDPAMRARQ